MTDFEKYCILRSKVLVDMGESQLTKIQQLVESDDWNDKDWSDYYDLAQYVVDPSSRDEWASEFERFLELDDEKISIFEDEIANGDLRYTLTRFGILDGVDPRVNELIDLIVMKGY